MIIFMSIHPFRVTGHRLHCHLHLYLLIDYMLVISLSIHIYHCCNTAVRWMCDARWALRHASQVNYCQVIAGFLYKSVVFSDTIVVTSDQHEATDADPPSSSSTSTSRGVSKAEGELPL